MEMRHQYVAHAGKSVHESCKCIFMLPPKKEYLKNHNLYPECQTELAQSVTFENFLEDCQPLIDEVYAHVKEKISNLEKKVLEQIKSISLKQYYKWADKNISKRIILKEADF